MGPMIPITISISRPMPIPTHTPSPFNFIPRIPLGGHDPVACQKKANKNLKSSGAYRGIDFCDDSGSESQE